MRPLTQKQIKIGWIVAAVLVFVHFAPGILAPVIRAIAMHRKQTEQPAQPKAFVHSVPEPQPALATGPALQLEAQQRFLGVWDGTQTLSGSSCRIHLELRLSPYQPGYVAGYETRVCFDLAKFLALQAKPNALISAAEQAKSPVATVLTGSLFEGDLTFRVDRTINSSEVACPVDSYSVAPFGAHQVVAMWRSHGDCPEGQMVLTRSRG